jgi:hypothetical protein
MTTATTVRSLRAIERGIVSARLGLYNQPATDSKLRRAQLQTLRLITRVKGKIPRGRLPAA